MRRMGVALYGAVQNVVKPEETEVVGQLDSDSETHRDSEGFELLGSAAAEAPADPITPPLTVCVAVSVAAHGEKRNGRRSGSWRPR